MPLIWSFAASAAVGSVFTLERKKQVLLNFCNYFVLWRSFHSNSFDTLLTHSKTVLLSFVSWLHFSTWVRKMSPLSLTLILSPPLSSKLAVSLTHFFSLSLSLTHSIFLSFIFLYTGFSIVQKTLLLFLSLFLSLKHSLSLARLSTLSLSLSGSTWHAHTHSLSSLARWCPRASGEQRVENSFKILPQFSLLSNKIRSSRRRRKKVGFPEKKQKFRRTKIFKT